MAKPLRQLARRYARTLETYLADRQEGVLVAAYVLGRWAAANGFGVLDVARVHSQTMASYLRASGSDPLRGAVWTAAETFLLEALSPFEITHRGFVQTNRRLQQVVAALEKRNLELAESEARLQAILDHSPPPIFVKDVHGRYLHINRQFERLFRLRRERVVGRTDAAMFPPAQAAAFQANDRKVLRTGVPLEFEETARYYDGTHTSLVSKFPLRDTQGRVYALCGIATDITTRKQAEEALRRSEAHYHQLFNEARLMEEKLRNLSNQILHAQEQERARISRELHDEVGQALTAISVNLATLHYNGGSNPRHAQQMLDDAQRLLIETMQTVHRFARELRPALLDDLGLLAALRSHLSAFARRTGLRVRFRASPLADRLSDEQKLVIFRVAQESLTNVAKHARANCVDVSIRRFHDAIRVQIADDGKSFRADSLGSAKTKQRLGLLGMQERVRLMNGTFAVKPEPGKGTTIQVVLPCRPGRGPADAKGRRG